MHCSGQCARRSLGTFQLTRSLTLPTPALLRDAAVTLVLASAASMRYQGSAPSRAASLHLQAAKVVSAHAASIGDLLLGVPLSCAAGLNADAVNVLQEAGLWRYAACLTAASLSDVPRAQALQRWAHHILLQEGSMWRAVGVLTAAGSLKAALQVLREAKYTDCAQAYVVAAGQAGLFVTPTGADAGEWGRGQGGVMEGRGLVFLPCSVLL